MLGKYACSAAALCVCALARVVAGTGARMCVCVLAASDLIQEDDTLIEQLYERWTFSSAIHIFSSPEVLKGS